jgi:Xaa-Pro dipeptidase
VTATDPARARYGRVQAAMARHGVGALLLATPHHAAFASGARRVQVAGSGGPVPWVVVPAGAPSATIFTTDPDGAPAWMARAAVEPLCWVRDRQLARIQALVAPTAGAIACDVWAPALVALAGALSRPLVDAAPLLADAAGPRSAVELAAIERALAAARTGVRAAVAGAGEGSVAAMLARAAATMSAAGAGFPVGEGLAWRDGARLAAKVPVGAAERIALEWGVYVDGHAGVAGDTVGAPEAARRRWFEVLCALAKRCRAEAPTAELRAAARAAGAGQLGGLVAYGLGVGIEPPFVDLERDDGTALAAGTVLVLAPVVDGFRATRALVVEPRGHRWLEPAP